MATANIKVTIKLPFWWKCYIHSVCLFAMAFNTEPDEEKVVDFIMQNASVKIG
jgi:hypothetical protein